MKKSIVPVYFADLSDASFEEATARITDALSQAEGALTGLQVLVTSERGSIDTVIRDGEREAIIAVLAASEAAPTVVVPLGDRFSPARLRTLLDRRDALLALAARAEAVALRFADSARVTARTVKSATSDAYELLKPVTQYDPEVASRLAPAIDFYASISRRSKPVTPVVPVG